MIAPSPTLALLDGRVAARKFVIQSRRRGACVVRAFDGTVSSWTPSRSGVSDSPRAADSVGHQRQARSQGACRPRVSAGLDTALLERSPRWYHLAVALTRGAGRSTRRRGDHEASHTAVKPRSFAGPSKVRGVSRSRHPHDARSVAQRPTIADTKNAHPTATRRDTSAAVAPSSLACDRAEPADRLQPRYFGTADLVRQTSVKESSRDRLDDVRQQPTV